MGCSVVSVLAVLVAGASLGTTVACGQAARTFGRIQGDNSVEILDLRNETWHRIYRSPKWGVTGLSVAPSGDRLALLSWTEGVVSGHDYSVPPSPELVIIDTLGRTLVSVPKVHRYDWCGAGCAVYITGEYEENDVGFKPSGVGMVDVANGRATPLPSPPHPIGITWNRGDGGAYVKNAAGEGEARIYRIDLASRALSPTDLKDHLFSPSGRHYLHRPTLLDSLEVYDTRSNMPVDISSLWREAKPIGWASSSEDVLLAVRRPPAKVTKPRDRVWARPMKPSDVREHSYVLYRISDRRTLVRAKGHLSKWAGPANLRLIRQGDKYRILDGR